MPSIKIIYLEQQHNFYIILIFSFLLSLHIFADNCCRKLTNSSKIKIYGILLIKLKFIRRKDSN